MAEAAYQVYTNRLILEEESITLSKGETAAIGIRELPTTRTVITVTVEGKGNYTGKTSTTFRILAKNMSIAKASAKVETKVYYTGYEIELTEKDITVRLGKTTLTENDFEIIDYSNNIKKGIFFPFCIRKAVSA